MQELGRQCRKEAAMTTHIPTPVSARIATIAKALGWTDNSHYGDTDYGMGQEFEQGRYWVRLEWGPDGRQGAANELFSVSVLDTSTKPVVKTVFHTERGSQPTLRSAAISALNEYAELR